VMGMRANEIEVGEAHVRSGRRAEVTAHGMRGLHWTLAVENGVSAHVVAASLGHESSATTIQSYVKPEEGGRLAS
jgi:site-specific recombinase XerD